MGLLTNLIGLVVVVVVVYLIYSYFVKKDKHLSGLKSASKAVVVDASKLPVNQGAANYAYSIWFYVSEWETRMADSKTILSRASGGSGGSSGSNPLITLAAYENNLDVAIETYPTSDNSQQQNQNEGSVGGTSTTCTVRNIPLQRWVNAIISLNGRTLDIYIDGKLVRTCILPGVPRIDNNAPIHITPDSGFAGWTSNLKYFAHPLNPQEAYNIYREGPGTSNLFGFFDKYKIKVAYLVDNKEEASIEI